MELYRLHAQHNDSVSSVVRRVDRIHVGLPQSQWPSVRAILPSDSRHSQLGGKHTSAKLCPENMV